MGTIVVEGTEFTIKGDNPTPREQLAIDSVLAKTKKDGGGLTFDEELSLMITPEQVLSDAQKGKYNKDTEGFLASPTFMRIVTEVGLSIAGGLAGAAMAPFSGGSSLALTAMAAARVARLARPLLNISASKVGLIGRATAGGAIGGGTGAAIAQTWDPRESIVREVARGALQGGAGEVLGFGLAGALAKGYNKITGFQIRQIDGARQATAGLARDREFMRVLKAAKDGKTLDAKDLKKLKDGIKGADGKYDVLPFTEEQVTILTTPNLTSRAIAQAGDLLEETGGMFSKNGIRAEKANISPGKLTENSTLETLSGIASASLLGGGVVRTAESMATKTTMQGINNFVDTVLYQLPKTGAAYDEAGLAIGELINQQLTKSHALYNTTKNKMWNDVNEALKPFKRPDGTFDPKYDVIWKGPDVPKNITVTRTPKDGAAFDEQASNLGDYINKALRENRNIDNEDVKGMLGILMRAEGRTDYQDFKNMYTAIASKRTDAASAPVQAELLARMQSMLNNSPLPGDVGILRQAAAKYTSLGGKPFNDAVLKRIMNTERGHENIYKQIVASGKASYYDEFFKTLDEGKINFKLNDGTTRSFDLFPNRELIKDGIRGQFFRDFLENSVDTGKQYAGLRKDQARKFLNAHKFLLDRPGFLTKSQIDNLTEYVNRMKFTEGTIKPTSAAGSNPAMFIQLNQAGSISQMIGVLGFGTGTLDPGSAAFFVLGPAGLSRAFASPKISRLMFQGLGGKGAQPINSYPKLSRYMGQLTTAMVGQGVISADQAQDTMNTLKGQKEYYDKFFSTGKYEGSIVTKMDPANAPAIPVVNERGETITFEESITEEVTAAPETGSAGIDPASIPVAPSNLNSMNNNANSRAALASGNIYGAIASRGMREGGIVRAKKVNS